jgi:hypothetical protein
LKVESGQGTSAVQQGQQPAACTNSQGHLSSPKTQRHYVPRPNLVLLETPLLRVLLLLLRLLLLLLLLLLLPLLSSGAGI